MKNSRDLSKAGDCPVCLKANKNIIRHINGTACRLHPSAAALYAGQGFVPCALCGMFVKPAGMVLHSRTHTRSGSQVCSDLSELPWSPSSTETTPETSPPSPPPTLLSSPSVPEKSPFEGFDPAPSSLPDLLEPVDAPPAVSGPPAAHPENSAPDVIDPAPSPSSSPLVRLLPSPTTPTISPVIPDLSGKSSLPEVLDPVPASPEAPRRRPVKIPHLPGPFPKKHRLGSSNLPPPLPPAHKFAPNRSRRLPALPSSFPT
jgi:hypothetical protein